MYETHSLPPVAVGPRSVPPDYGRDCRTGRRLRLRIRRPGKVEARCEHQAADESGDHSAA
jgi:hypothetical protein